MIDLRRLIAASILAALVAACGGSASSVPDGTSTTPSDAAASQEAPNATPTEAPAATPDETGTGGGGGGGATSTACQLVTVDEAGGVLGQDGLTVTMDSPGDVSYCIYSDSAGAAIIASSLMTRGGSGAFSAWKAGAGVQQVDGLGDDAVFDPSSATLLVLKGDAIFSVTAGDGSQAEAQRIEWSKALAEIAIGRM